MSYANDGYEPVLWEPLYRLAIPLSPTEQAIIRNPAFRRLMGIHHNGACAYFLPRPHTRYLHTLGVFTLTAHFCPDWAELRLAALIHDLGHLPFSHSAERALGYDHHTLGWQVVQDSGIGEIITRAGFDLDSIWNLTAGNPANPLVCGKEGMSIDHIDSWLRDSEVTGFGEVPPHQLLRSLYLFGPYLATDDPAVAMEVVRRVAANHRDYLQPRALATDALVTELFRQALPDVGQLLKVGDEQALDMAARTVPELVAMLRERPWEAVAHEQPPAGPSVKVSVHKLYTGQLRLAGRPVAEVLPEARAIYEELESLKRTYFVTFGR